MAQRGRIDLHHVCCDLLVVGVERIPSRNARGTVSQLGVLRHDTELLLARKGLFANLIPALIELALEFGDPILGRMVRGVRRAWSEICQPWLVGRNRPEQANPFDGLVRHILVEEIVFDIVRRLDWLDVLENGRSPLAGVATDKTIKIFKSQSGRPQIEWPGLAVVPVRHVVIFAVPRGVIAVLPKYLSEGSDTFRHERVVTRETGSPLHDDTGRGGVVIASGQERCAGR